MCYIIAIDENGAVTGIRRPDVTDIELVEILTSLLLATKLSVSKDKHNLN